MKKSIFTIAVICIVTLNLTIETLNCFAQAGSLDNSFDGDGRLTTAFGSNYSESRSATLQPDGKIVTAGFYCYSGTKGVVAVTRYNTDGSLDNTFDVDGKKLTSVGSVSNSDDRGYSVAIQIDGKIVVAGYSYNGANKDFAVVRYNSDGSLDNTFDTDGKQTTAIGTGDDWGYSVAIQTDGKIIVAGYSFNGIDNDFAMCRYNSDGSLDDTFDGDGKLTTDIGSNADYGRSIALQSDGKILVAGYSNNGTNWDFALVRYNSNGSLDNSFDGDGIQTTTFGNNYEQGYSVAIQPDGKIIVSGTASNGTNSVFALARYNNDGSLDNTFDGDGKLTTAIGSGQSEYAYSVAIQPDGKIVAAGTSSSSTFNGFAVTRYNSDGSLDVTFNGDGKVTTAVSSGNHFYDAGYALAIQPDGKIVMAGCGWVTGVNYTFAVVRYIGVGCTIATPGTISGNTTVCSASSTTYSTTAVSGAISYTWTLPSGWTGTSTTTSITTIASTTSGTISVKANNSCGSSTAQIISVTVNPLPSLIVNATATTVCTGTSVTLTGTGASSYSWTGGVTNGLGFVPSSTTTYTVTGTDGNGCSNTATKIIIVNPLPTIGAIASVTTICAGNSVTLTGTGATSYSWSGGVTDGLGFVPTNTTTYTVTGTDGNNCSNTATKTITVNSLPTIGATASATTVCAGTSVTLTGTGATSYSWTGGVTNGLSVVPSSTATYTVTGTNGNNCSNTATKTITVNPLPTIGATASATTVCAGTSVTLAGTGATSYAWTGGVTNGLGFVPSSTTTYTVTGTNGNNCSNTATKTITVNPLPTVGATASATTVCTGTSVTLTGTGATSYSWSDELTNGLEFVPSSTSTYTVTGTDGNDCSNTATTTVTVNPLPDATTNLNGLTITANQNGAAYQWLDCNNGNSLIAGATNQSYTASINGDYAVIVTLYGCSNTSACVNFNTTGIDETVKNNQLTVYPNPNNGVFIIKSTSEGVYSIMDELGQTVQLLKLNSTNNYSANIENISNGIYLIVGFNNNKMTHEKIVVNK